MKTNYSKNIGSVSSGTMRNEDVIPALVAELESQKPLKRKHRQLVREIKRDWDANGYYESDRGWEDSASLFDALQEYCLPYFYFGAHPGDGSDYGYWLSESFQDDFEELQVSDLSEVPTGHTGEVLLVNDHGNMSLYAYNRGRYREVWSVV